MLSIYVKREYLQGVTEVIQTVDRLDELVNISDLEVKKDNKEALIVDNTGLRISIDWADNTPPYLIAPIPFTPDNLLACIFFKLHNLEAAWNYFDDESILKKHFAVMDLLQDGYYVNEEIISFVIDDNSYAEFGAYFSKHNGAILYHYGNFEQQHAFETVKALYDFAVANAPDARYKAFSIKHYAIFLLDNGLLDQAETLIRQVDLRELADSVIRELHDVLIDVLLKKLVIPYDEFLLDELKSLLWESIERARAGGDTIKEGLRLLDASHVAFIDKNFAESLRYLNKAIDIFTQEDIQEFMGEALRRRGALLLSWAQNGNPQFYKSSLESYQAALKIFTKENAPAIFAEIHQDLGVIYTDMPVEEKKKGLMASIANSSFQQALEFYAKENYPYEYARICTLYGNALCKFPPAIHTDNFEKALFYYHNALQIRTKAYPYERALTLLNYLEASWNVKEEKDFNEERFNDMEAKAKEVLELVEDEEIRAEAMRHLENLHELKKIIQK